MNFNQRNKTIFFYLNGGLGNQLFQISNAIAFNEKHFSSTAEIMCVLGTKKDRFYEEDSYKSYLFGEHNIKVLEPTFQIFKLCNFLFRIRTLKSVYLRKTIIIMSEIFLSVFFRKKIKLIIPTNLGFEVLPQENRSSIFLLGYFQSFKFIQSTQLLEKLKNKKLTLENHLLEKTDKLSRNLIIHVRLGDYLDNPQFGTLSKDYYIKSFAFVKERYYFDKVYVFTNDEENVSKYLPQLDDFEYQIFGENSGTSLEVLEFMRNGSIYILANSSFSLWGAFLSYDPHSIVLAPTPWFKQIDSPSTLYPKGWILRESLWT